MDPNQGQPTQTPPGQQPTQPQPSTGSNTIAVIGLIFSFFWPVGLVCSILGLKKAEKLGGKGSGIALAGIIVSIIVGLVGLILFPIVFIAVPAVQRNSRNTQRRADISTLEAAIQIYSANHVGVLPSNNTELDEALSTSHFGSYSNEGSTNGLTAAGTQTDDLAGHGVIAIEQVATITSADFSPTADEVQIVLQAQCNSSSSLAADTAYTAKGANLLDEGIERDFAIIYALEGETNVFCIDNS